MVEKNEVEKPATVSRHKTVTVSIYSLTSSSSANDVTASKLLTSALDGCCQMCGEVCGVHTSLDDVTNSGKGGVAWKQRHMTGEVTCRRLRRRLTSRRTSGDDVIGPGSPSNAKHLCTATTTDAGVRCKHVDDKADKTLSTTLAERKRGKKLLLKDAAAAATHSVASQSDDAAAASRDDAEAGEDGGGASDNNVLKKKSYSEVLASGLVRKMSAPERLADPRKDTNNPQGHGGQGQGRSADDRKQHLSLSSAAQPIPNNLVKSRNDVSCRRSNIHSYAGKLSNVDLQWNDLNRLSPAAADQSKQSKHLRHHRQRSASPGDATDSSESLTDGYPSSVSEGGGADEYSQEELDFIADYTTGPSLIGYHTSTSATPPVFSPSYSCSPPASAALYSQLLHQHAHQHLHHFHHHHGYRHGPNSPLYSAPPAFFCDSPGPPFVGSWPPLRHFIFPPPPPPPVKMSPADVAMHQLNRPRHRSQGGGGRGPRPARHGHQRSFSSSSTQQALGKGARSTQGQGRGYFNAKQGSAAAAGNDTRRKRTSSCMPDLHPPTSDFQGHNFVQTSSKSEPPPAVTSAPTTSSSATAKQQQESAANGRGRNNNVLVDLTNSNLSSSYSIYGTATPAAALLKTVASGYVHVSCNFFVHPVVRPCALLQPCYLPVSAAAAAGLAPFSPSPSISSLLQAACCTAASAHSFGSDNSPSDDKVKVNRDVTVHSFSKADLEMSLSAPHPPPRPWIEVGTADTSKPGGQVTVMCYNVLCDKYATRQQYGYCPTWALCWDYRKKAILLEIQRSLADIISLQEVETDQFHEYFLPALADSGYGGIFLPKSRARTVSESERQHVDGCAIFYNKSKFQLVKKHLIEFNQLAISNAEGSHDMLNRVMTKDNIGLAALLQTTEAFYTEGQGEGQLLLVATCHMHWDPEYCDVKLIQTMMLIHELRALIRQLQRDYRLHGNSTPAGCHDDEFVDCNALPLILCGDLNSLPESGVIDYLTNGSVSADHADFKGRGYSESLRKLSVGGGASAGLYTHDFRLQQAYTKEIMPFTNYTHHFQGIIDYIFFSRDFMRPLRVMGPTDITWFERNKVIGCPHPHIPSDHLPLMIQVQLTTPISLASPPSQAQSEIPMTSLEFPATSESLLVKQSPTTAADTQTLPVSTDETTL